MKTLKLFPLLFFFPAFVNAQHFDFKISFQDTFSNIDTLIYGYDLTATNGIDATFGEINIMAATPGKGLDVRFSNVLVNGKTSPDYQSKKQIISDKCPDWLFSEFGVSIEIDSKAYPVTVKWDRNLFKDSCRIGTILTDVHPGGWFDTRGHFRVFLSEKDSIVVKKPYYSYINSSGKKIGVFWIAFMDSSVYEIPFDPIIFEPDPLTINQFEKENEVEIFPNPIQYNLYIRSNNIIQTLELYELYGKKILSKENEDIHSVNLASIPAGIYLVKLRDDKGNTIIKKIIK